MIGRDGQARSGTAISTVRFAVRAVRHRPGPTLRRSPAAVEGLAGG